MPRFLRLVMGVGALWGGFGAILCAGFYSMASADIGPYTVNGAAVSKEDFLTFARPAVFGYFVLCLAILGLSWALHRRRSWSRPLFMGITALSVLFGVGTGLWFGAPLPSALTTLVVSGLMVASLWWYLYRDDAVVSWFDAMENRPEPIG